MQVLQEICGSIVYHCQLMSGMISTTYGLTIMHAIGNFPEHDVYVVDATESVSRLISIEESKGTLIHKLFMLRKTSKKAKEVVPLHLVLNKLDLPIHIEVVPCGRICHSR
ncbi:hypothetical protein ACJX0J_019110 [Zea mays]